MKALLSKKTLAALSNESVRLRRAEKHRIAMATPEARLNISRARIGNKNALGCKHSEDECRRKSHAAKLMWARRKGTS